MMLKAKIKVDGKYFMKESLEEYHKLEKGSLSIGFTQYTNKEISKLLFTENQDEAHEAWGARGINNVLQKIEQRLRMGVLGGKIEIDIYE